MTSTLNIVLGLPDDQTVQVSRVLSNGFKFMLVGTASFLEHIREDLSFNECWVGPGAPATSRIGRGPLVNYIADPDACSKALAAALENSKRIKRPWFNHPAHVARTGRDAVCEMLQGIPGLDIPRTTRLQSPIKPADIFNALRQNNFDGAVLARIAGKHGGQTLVRLENADDHAGLAALPWVGRDVYLTQFADFKDADGLYRKWRIAVIGGTPLLDHVFIGENWLINGAKRLLTNATRAEISKYYAMFDAGIAPFLRATIEAIYSRLRLDYFGIDCSLRPDGRLLIFEVNACMDLLKFTHQAFEPVKKAKQRNKEALVRLLHAPENWADVKFRHGNSTGAAARLNGKTSAVSSFSSNTFHHGNG